MEGLELKHLAPYLPYGLKYYIPLDSDRISDFVDEEPWKFTHNIYTAIEAGYESALSYKKMFLTQKEPFISYEDGDLFLGQMITSCGFDVDDVFLHEVKPVLRPLSDLTKEIEVNGEKFVPCDILFKCDAMDVIMGFSSKEDAFNFISDKNRNELCFPLDFWTKIFELHFDIYGLIEKNLAIDINTL